MNQHDSNIILYSLLAHKDGSWLKKCVYQSLGYKSLKEAQEAVSHLLLMSIDNDNEPTEELNIKIGKIVAATNAGSIENLISDQEIALSLTP